EQQIFETSAKSNTALDDQRRERLRASKVSAVACARAALSQRAKLPLNLMRHPCVVGVEKRYILPFALFNAAITRRRDALVLLAHISNRCEVRQYRLVGVIRRPVVNHDNFEIAT